MRSKFTIVLLAVLVSVVPEVAKAQLTGSLTVEVQGLQSQAGNVCFKLFNGSQGFPNNNDSAVRRTCVAIVENLPEPPDAPFSHTFIDLPAGTYAVAIYHDSNGDEQLNRGTFGIPTEGYGFSNDAPATNAPARYEDAVFLLAGSRTTVPIRMRYGE
jgi:uncharacterized protein (DUF2141 family)